MLALDARIDRMRHLQRQFRLSARSIPEITGSMETVLARYGMSRKIEFRGRKLSTEAFINAAILHMLDLPEREQDAALIRAMMRLESILKDDGQPPPVVNDTTVLDSQRPKGRKRGKAG